MQIFLDKFLDKFYLLVCTRLDNLCVYGLNNFPYSKAGRTSFWTRLLVMSRKNSSIYAVHTSKIKLVKENFVVCTGLNLETFPWIFQFNFLLNSDVHELPEKWILMAKLLYLPHASTYISGAVSILIVELNLNCRVLYLVDRCNKSCGFGQNSLSFNFMC